MAPSKSSHVYRCCRDLAVARTASRTTRCRRFRSPQISSPTWSSRLPGPVGDRLRVALAYGPAGPESAGPPVGECGMGHRDGACPAASVGTQGPRRWGPGGDGARIEPAAGSFARRGSGVPPPAAATRPRGECRPGFRRTGRRPSLSHGPGSTPGEGAGSPGMAPVSAAAAVAARSPNDWRKRGPRGRGKASS